MQANRTDGPNEPLDRALPTWVPLTAKALVGEMAKDEHYKVCTDGGDFVAVCPGIGAVLTRVPACSCPAVSWSR